MRQFILMMTASFLVASSFGQTPFKKNTLYLEAGGSGLFGSLNYERQLTKEPGIGLRLGVGFYSENVFYLTVPVGINYLFPLKKENSFIDAGAGITWTRVHGDLFGPSKSSIAEHYVNFIPSIGYRRHTGKDVMWRISLTPVINKFTFVPWLGVSIGKRF